MQSSLKGHCEVFWDLCLHHLATMRHCRRSSLMAVLFLQHLLREQTGHHLPEGGNSFHCAEQAKQTLLKVWSLQGSKGHGALWSFHRSHQRCDTGIQQTKITLRTWQWCLWKTFHHACGRHDTIRLFNTPKTLMTEIGVLIFNLCRMRVDGRKTLCLKREHHLGLLQVKDAKWHTRE